MGRGNISIYQCGIIWSHRLTCFLLGCIKVFGKLHNVLIHTKWGYEKMKCHCLCVPCSFESYIYNLVLHKSTDIVIHRKNNIKLHKYVM